MQNREVQHGTERCITVQCSGVQCSVVQCSEPRGTSVWLLTHCSALEQWWSGERRLGGGESRRSPTVRWMLLQSIGDIEIFSFLCQCSVGLNVFVSSCNKCMYTTRSAVSHITLHHQNRVLQLWMWQSSVLYVFFTWVRLGSIGLIWVYCGSLVFT